MHILGVVTAELLTGSLHLSEDKPELTLNHDNNSEIGRGPKFYLRDEAKFGAKSNLL